MRKTVCFCVALIFCILLIFAMASCGKNIQDENSTEVTMEKFYCEEDFQSIIVGQSTFRDVYSIAPANSMQVTSYGGVCEYPTKGGGCIRIKFYGNDLVVGSIEKTG